MFESCRHTAGVGFCLCAEGCLRGLCGLFLFFSGNIFYEYLFFSDFFCLNHNFLEFVKTVCTSGCGECVACFNFFF